MTVSNRRLSRRTLLALGVGAACALLGACQTPTSPVRPVDPRAGLPTPEPKPTAAPPVVAKPTLGTTPGAGEAAAVPAGPPKQGGKLVAAVEAGPADLDPYTDDSLVSLQAWGGLVYQGLVMYDEHLKLVPCLAEAWVNTSPTTWTFKLRQGVHFHDGSEFEAADVRYWFERVARPAANTPAGSASWPGVVAGVEPHGRYEVEVTLAAPYAPLLARLAGLRGGSAIAPRGWLQGAGATPETTAVGSGPFKIAEYVPSSHIRYVKHPDYWEKGLPHLDEIVLEVEPNEAARASSLRSGQVRYAVLGPGAERPLRSETSLAVRSSPGAMQLVTQINASRPPFDDVRVRQAIGLAVDREQAIEQVLSGGGLLTGPMPTGHGAWALDPGALPYRHDVDSAKRLLTEAGHPDGFEASVRLAPDAHDAPLASSLAALLADQLRAVGIALRTERLDPPALLKARGARDFDLLIETVDFLPDPDDYFRRYATGSPANGGGFPIWANARYDEAIEQARSILDPGQRKLLYDEAAGILLDEVPAIWWCTRNRVEILHTSVKGYAQAYTGLRTGLKAAWLDG
jgi:peptide/nickel transport system substrate-binding protein